MLPASTTPQAQFNRHTIINNIAALFSGSVIAQGLTTLTLLLTARHLGSAYYGQYAGCFTLTGLTGIVFSLGMDIWLLREGGRDCAGLGRIVGSALAIKTGLGLLWFVLVSTIAPLISPSTFPADLVRWSALASWLDSVLATLLTVYKATLRNKTTSILQAASDGAWFLITLTLLSRNEIRTSVYVQGRVLALALSCIITTYLMIRWLPLKPVFSIMKRIINESVPFAASELLAVAAMRIDVLIIAFLLGKTAVGLYSPAIGLINALFLVPATVYNVIVPVLSYLFVNHPKQAWLTAKRSLGLLFLLGAGLSIIVVLSADFFTQVLGPSYANSLPILQLLSIVLTIHSLVFGLVAVLVAIGQQKKRTLAQSVAVITNIALNFLIVPRFGIQGAAGVYILTEIILFIGYGWVVYRYGWRLAFNDNA